ncbi:MAG: universal stress protein, partial [Pseudomonadota bacterium]
RQVDIIKHFGRLADLVCVAQPDRDRNLGANTLKGALFNTGRPVLMCPHRETVPETFADHVVIAWNGSLEATRAVAQTMALIKAAKSVRIVTVGGEEVHGASSAELRDYFAMHGVTSTVDRLDSGQRIGDALLEASASDELMIMGAYGESHEKETLFGGNTQTIVDRAKTPVVLVH